MRYGALLYGYATSVDDILMPRAESRIINSRQVLMDTEGMYPIEWAAEHHRYGKYVFPISDDMVVFGTIIGEAGDALEFEDISAAESVTEKAIAATKFFCDKDIDAEDCYWHVVTLE